MSSSPPDRAPAGAPEPRETGAIHGASAGEQPNSWEIRKTDLASEGELRRAEAASGERPAGPADEADHGPVRTQPPENFTGLKLSPVAEVAAGATAVASTVKFALEQMGPVRGLRMLKQLNQKDGYDCPGCAWPDPQGHRSVAEFCENGARAAAEEATTRRVDADFFRRYSVAELSERSDHWLGQQGRITHPLVLRRGAAHYEPIGWDDAFRMIAAELTALDSPDEAIFYTSGRTSNEAAFLYQLFVRQFGTNNLPDCSNMCHESSGTALTETIGIGKGTVTLDDFNKAELILVIGQNPGTCHPRMLSALEDAVHNGCRIIAVNPLPEAGLNRFKQPQDFQNPFKAPATLLGNGTRLAEFFVPVRINGDVPLLKGVMKEMLEAEERAPGTVFDHAFIRERTAGFEPFLAALWDADWDDIVARGGIERPLIRRFAEAVMGAERIIVTWAMGLTQHRNAVANIQEICNLLFLRGSIGKPGAGACPVRGHSNVQGDRTVGIWERPRPEFLDALAREFAFEPPREHGWDTVEATKAMHAGRGKVFFAMGGNFLSATPDTEYTAAALRRTRLTAYVSTKLNRAHLVTGEQALILPCLGRTERDEQPGGPQFVSVEDSMGVVRASRGNLAALSPEMLSEPRIVARLAVATLDGRSTVDWTALADDYDRIRDAIERCIPGFDDYNRRVREPGGFHLPNLAREGRFQTHTGKANFTVHPLPDEELAPDEYLMMTIRSHDQFNTTIYGLDDRYRGIHNERRVVLMNERDVREAGLRPEQPVDLRSRWNGTEREVRRFLVVPYPIPRRCVATYFPEANPLIPIDKVAERSNTPASKSVAVTIHPAA